MKRYEHYSNSDVENNAAFTINLSRVFINFLINNSPLKITYLNIIKFFINNFLTASVTEFYLIFSFFFTQPRCT